MKKVAILISTYNGEKFIKEQLCSLKNQDYAGEVEIFVRDDGSRDKTVEILKNEGVKNIIEGENVGFAKSFFAVLKFAYEKSDAELFFFCDQDDVWKKEKITKMVEAAKSYDTKKPFVIFHNLALVDENLNSLNVDIYQKTSCNPKKTKFRDFWFHANVWGCSMMFSRALASLFVPANFELKLPTHDNMINLVNAYFGDFCFLDEKLVLYRQHGHNLSSGNQQRKKQIFKRFSATPYCDMLRAFLQLFGERLPQKERAALQEVANIDKAGFFKKRYLLLKHRVGKNNWLMSVGLFVKI